MFKPIPIPPTATYLGTTTPGPCPHPCDAELSAIHTCTRYGIAIVLAQGQYWAFRGDWVSFPLELWQSHHGNVLAVPCCGKAKD